MPPHRLRRSIVLLACVATVAGAATGTAVAADGPTQVSVVPARTLVAGDRAPFDVPGVRAIRRGRRIPRGYVLPGQTVTVATGAATAGAGLRFTCPGGKRLKSFAVTGRAGFLAPDDYSGRRSTVVVSIPSAGRSRGTVYAVCR